MAAKILIFAVLTIIAITSASAAYQRFYADSGAKYLARRDGYCTTPVGIRYKKPVLNSVAYGAYSVCGDGHILLLPHVRTPVRRYGFKPQHLMSIRGHPMVAGYWADTNPTCHSLRGNKVSYRESCSRPLLRYVKAIVNDFHFNPQSVVWVTYDHVLPYGCARKTNTFQILLATHHSTTYAIFIYRNMQWKTATSSSNAPVVGFTDGRGKGYQYYTTNCPTNHLSQSIKIFRISNRFTTAEIPRAQDNNLESIANLEAALKAEEGKAETIMDQDEAIMEQDKGNRRTEELSEADEVEMSDDEEAQIKEEQIQKALKVTMEGLNDQ